MSYLYDDDAPELPERYIDEYDADLECECKEKGTHCPHLWNNLSPEEQDKVYSMLLDRYIERCNEPWED